jgi:hypothetical protein
MWSLVESKLCHDIMVEAAGHLKLLPASILDNIKCLNTLIYCQSAYSSSLKYLYPHSMAASTTSSALPPSSCWCLLSSCWCCRLHWHCHPLCADIIALIVLSLPSLLCWCCCPCCAGVAIVCRVVYHVVWGLGHASSTRAKKPANQLYNASTTRAKRPVQ